MLIGGYTMEDNGVHGITVTEIEAGWSFYLDGDAAKEFRANWKLWQGIVGDSFECFLNAQDYNLLFE